MADAYAAMASPPPDWVSEHLRHPYPQISELEMHLEKLRDDAFRMEYRYVFNEHLILQRVHRYLARVFLPGYKAFTLLCSLALPLLAWAPVREGGYRCIFFIRIKH